MQEETRLDRKKKVQFAVRMAAIDGGKPSAFTKKLLEQYENGQLTSSQLKQAIVKKYTRASQ